MKDPDLADGTGYPASVPAIPVTRKPVERERSVAHPEKVRTVA